MLVWRNGSRDGFKFRCPRGREGSTPFTSTQSISPRKGSKLSDNKAKKQAWEMTYDELFQDWSSRYSFGAKGELTPNEAREIHNKWKNLGIQARLGLI